VTNQQNRLKTGVPELDRMLSGGLMRNDTVLLAGSAGTGKSTMGIQYLRQGAADGEPGIYLTFEELPDQIYRDAANFGWDLKKLEKEGLLRVVCTSPDTLLEPQGLQAVLQEPIKDIHPRRIVIDSLSHFSMFVEPKDLRLQIYQDVMFFKAKEISSLLIWETTQVGGQSFAVSDVGVSFLSDAIILLKMIEIDSSLRRGIVVIKMRGSQHDPTRREYQITPSGVKILGTFENYQGLMAGNPTRSGAEKFADLFGKAAKGK
jgi:circadian clock protein KaiC